MVELRRKVEPDSIIITCRVRKGIQDRRFEPFEVEMTVEKTVKVKNDEEMQKSLENLYEDLHNTVMDAINAHLEQDNN
jgi:hypothetical protein